MHVDTKSEQDDNIKVKELGNDISAIIEKNFRNTGLFNPLKDAFVQKPDIAHLKPRFEDWRLIKSTSFSYRKITSEGWKTKS